jgi:hypothetical protein
LLKIRAECCGAKILDAGIKKKNHRWRAKVNAFAPVRREQDRCGGNKAVGSGHEIVGPALRFATCVKYEEAFAGGNDIAALQTEVIQSAPILGLFSFSMS